MKKFRKLLTAAGTTMLVGAVSGLAVLAEPASITVENDLSAIEEALLSEALPYSEVVSEDTNSAVPAQSDESIPEQQPEVSVPEETLQGSWKFESNHWYYIIGDQRKTGWTEVNGKWYYMDGDGVMLTGWIHDGNTWFYTNQDGVLQTGWIKLKNNWYYLKNNGEMAVGWANVNDHWYYLNQNGVMLTGWINDWGTWYYTNRDGVLQTGWLYLNQNWYYLKEDGAMTVGNYPVKGIGYTFDNNGVMMVSAEGWMKDGDIWYYYENNVKQMGWKLINQIWYFFDDKGMMRTGWQTIDEKKYYFQPSGAMVTGTQIIDGKSYQFDGNGVLQLKVGWQLEDNTWYYYNEKEEKVTGWLTLNNKKYYLDPISGAMLVGTHNIDGVEYTFDASGALIINSSDEKPGEKPDQTPTPKPPTNSNNEQTWQQSGNDWYLIDVNGNRLTEWQKVNNNWYYLGSDGAMRIGWQSIGGQWYYMNSSGVMQTGWLYSKGELYYLHTSGVMATGDTTVDGIVRHFDGAGILTTKLEGIDVSSHQKNIDWKQVKNSGMVDFAIIRTGYGKEDQENQEDKYFEQNINQAISVGLPVGVYHFSYATSVENAKLEAQLCLKILSDAGIQPGDLRLPVVFDVEDAKTTGKLDPQTITEVVKVFCDIVGGAGYRTMVYANKTWFTSKMNFEEISSKYYIWLAQYNETATFYDMGKVDMWQYTSSGSVPGIEGRVDKNVLFDSSLIQ